jgi:hypothetical protein
MRHTSARQGKKGGLSGFGSAKTCGWLRITTSPEILGSTAEGPMHYRPRVLRHYREPGEVHAEQGCLPGFRLDRGELVIHESEPHMPSASDPG